MSNKETKDAVLKSIENWSASTEEIMERLQLCMATIKVDLKENQKTFNNVIHEKDFDPKVAVAYIYRMNELINAIQTVTNLKLKPENKK